MTSGRDAHAHVVRRRRRAALGGLAAVALLAGSGAAALFGGDEKTESAQAAPKQLPRGGRELFPHYRVVAYYGAPQDDELGVLGIGRPAAAGRALLRRSRAYVRPRRPVMPAFELIAAIVHRAPGPDGTHRQRQAPAVISRYLAAVRRIKGLLILDVQPGRSDFLEEARALEPYLKEPDVGLALDSEWSVPEGVVPGEAIGSTDAAAINRVSAYLSELVRRRRLPQKLLVVHQFTAGMVKDRSAVAQRPGLAIAFNVDGFGAPAVKLGVYRRLALARAAPPARSFFNGMKLFFREDTELMSPKTVLGVRPRPDLVVYE